MFLLFQDYPKSGTLVQGGGLYKDPAGMVIFDDALGKCKSKPPAAGLACKSGSENGLEPRFRDALAGIAHVNVDMIDIFGDLDGNLAGAFHGIHGVFGEVFDHPLEEVKVEWHHDLRVKLRDDLEGNTRGDPRADIFDGLIHHLYNVGGLQFRRRSDL